MRPIGALLLAVGLIAAACSSVANDVAPTTSVSQAAPEPTAVEAPATTAAPTQPAESVAPAKPDIAAANVALRRVANADAPLTLIQRPGSNRLTIGERSGRVRLLDLESGDVSDPILDLSEDVTTDAERGLLSLAYNQQGTKLYVHYSDRDGHTAIDEYDLSNDDITGQPRRLLSAEQPFANHNGGQIAIGPDGLLYIGLGDGGARDDPFEHGQDLDTLLGAILRIDPAGDPYSVPAENPFGTEILYPGMRNPWRFSFDSATGDLWIADVGQNAVEEVNLVPAAEVDDGPRNFGWNTFEGSEQFTPGDVADHHLPYYEYGRADGACSVTGGYVYRSAEIADLNGVYLFGDYCTSTLWGLQQTEAGPTFRDFGNNIGEFSLASFGQDLAGNVFLLSLDGTIYQVVPG